MNASVEMEDVQKIRDVSTLMDLSTAGNVFMVSLGIKHSDVTIE